MENKSNRIASSEIINTAEPYYYNKLIYNIHELLSRYTFIQSIIIGNSVLGKSIPCIKNGKGSNVVLYHAWNSCKWVDYIITHDEIYRKLLYCLWRK